MIVAIAGRKRSGKDTAAIHLLDHYSFTPYYLASPIKCGLAAMFNFTLEQLLADEKDDIDPRYGVTPRQMMQTLGTDWGQHTLMQKFPIFNMVTGRDLWVKLFFYQAFDPRYNWVIPDVRFQHEIDGLNDICEETYSLYIDRPGMPEDTHESEQTELETDYEILNDGSIEDLLEAVDTFMEDLR